MATMQPTLAPAPGPIRSNTVSFFAMTPIVAMIADDHGCRRVVPINVRRSTDFPNFPCLDLTFLLEFEDLRERLLAQGMHGSNGQTLQRIDHQPSSHASIHPHDQNIDPAIAGSGLINAGAGDSGADGNQSDGKKGKRELSTSKRAAQNRAAQVSWNPISKRCSTVCWISAPSAASGCANFLKGWVTKTAY